MTLQELLDHPRVKRISVGKCVDGRKWESEEVDAHAHVHSEDPKRGWICVRNPRDILCANNCNLSRTMMHEFCHLISSKYHDDRWRKAMHRLGQPIPKRYQKRKRSVAR